MSYFKNVSAATPTRFWINNVTRKQAEMALEAGATGCTQNPSYTYKMLTTKDAAEKDYVFSVLDTLLDIEDNDDVQVELQRLLVNEVAKTFMPLYEATNGKQGYVSIQGDPFKEDADSIIKFALKNIEASPNIMAKIPATEDGFKAIEYLIPKGVPLNVTEVMSVAQAMETCEIYEKCTKGMKNPAPIYYSHIAGIFDDCLKNQKKAENIEIEDGVLWEGGISVAKKVMQMTKELYPQVGFIGGGARGLHHFTEMVGGDACITINWEGTADKLIELNPPVVQNFLRPVAHSTIDKLCEKFDTYRKAYFRSELTSHEYEEFAPVVLFRESFEQAWKDALVIIADRKAQKR